MTAACGGESLDAFFDAYVREVEDALTHRGTRNMLYSIDSEEQAVSVLKNNYDFLYFADHDVDSAIDNFLNDLASLVRIDEATEARLQDALHLFFAEQPESGPESESFNTNFRTYIENRDAGRIFLMLTDVSSLLKSALSDDDYTTFSRKHLIQQNKTVAAYNYLVRKYNDEIYRGRIKGWIPPYDLEIEYLADRVLFPKDQSAKR